MGLRVIIVQYVWFNILETYPRHQKYDGRYKTDFETIEVDYQFVDNPQHLSESENKL